MLKNHGKGPGKSLNLKISKSMNPVNCIFKMNNNNIQTEIKFYFGNLLPVVFIILCQLTINHLKLTESGWARWQNI